MQYEYSGTYEAWCAGLLWRPGETKDVTDPDACAELDASALHARPQSPKRSAVADPAPTAADHEADSSPTE